MKTYSIFETHAHYDDEAFEPDRDGLLSSLQGNGIGTVVNVCASVGELGRTIALTEKYPFVYGAVGVHYWHKEEAAHEIQKKMFRAQMDIAREEKLPFMIHSRDAAKDTLDIVKEYMDEGMYGGIIHCFSYGKEMAEQYLNMGLYLGIGGVVTFKNAKKLKEVVEYAPLEQLVLETDSPYLSPEPNRGKRNSSLNLPYVARAIGELKGISEEEVIRITGQNAEKLLFHRIK